jgi:DNA ligase (NAD+)
MTKLDNIYSHKFITSLIQNPITEAKKLSILELEKLLTVAAERYYNTKEQLIPDDIYDELIDYLTEVSPTSKILSQVGSQPVDEASKVKLPYHLGSMDKIKPGSRKLELWFNKFANGPYVISDKLDGLSGLLVVELDNNMELVVKLYTRGNGTYGQDISHLLDYIKWGSKTLIKKAVVVSKDKRIVVRGEIIINESIYMKKYASKYPKSRSLVAGIVNSKPDSKSFNTNKGITEDIEFISYQLVYPENIRADKQFELLEKYGFLVVNNKVFTNDNNTVNLKSVLDEMFITRRNDSKYKIDGIIITDCSSTYENPKNGNPKHSIAFKMPLSDQQAETVVEEVEYNISKNGVLKPRIRYKPINVDGDTLTYTTGFNAKYIRDNIIGPGSRIRIIRSGDVIPYIKEVISSASNGKWAEPTIDYYWSKSEVEALVKDLSGSTEYLSKQLLHFFKVMNVDGMKIGTINKLISAGFDTIEIILALRPENLLDVAGFNVRSSEKLINNLKTQILDKEHKLEVVMTASNIFKGFGVKKLGLIVDYMKVTGFNLADLTIDKIKSIDGFSTKTAKQVIDFIPEFIKWLNNHSQINVTDIHSMKKSDYNNEKDFKNVNSALKKNIVITGFRNSELVSIIEASGGKVQSSVNGKTDILIVKDNGSMKGSKYNKAKSLNIEIDTLQSFIKKHNLEL